MKLNPKIIVGSIFMVALCVISLSLFFKFGLGFGSTTTITEDSPDMSEKVSQSQNEQLSNSEETSSHNTNSWHINISSGLLIMSLVILVGGLYSIHKYHKKTSVRLAQERRLSQRQMGPKTQDHKQDRTEVDQTSIVSNDKHLQNFQNFPVPSLPNVATLQYQNSYVENEPDMNNQLYPQMQRRHWTERDQRVLMYNPIYPGFQSTAITGYQPQSMDRPHPSAPLERLMPRREEKETETNRPEIEKEKEDDKKQLEALKRQNQLLVNKFQQLHDSIEADI